jgi:hypothetical protein
LEIYAPLVVEPTTCVDHAHEHNGIRNYCIYDASYTIPVRSTIQGSANTGLALRKGWILGVVQVSYEKCRVYSRDQWYKHA